MSKITIFEGPDGGGKTTTAIEFARKTGAHYCRFSACRHMGDQFPRLFLEAMTPALMGLKDVVFDRSWISEEPYNSVFHKSELLITNSDIAMLNRAAMRCDTRVVLCLPSVDTCLHNFNNRRADEMLETENQLMDVYHRYNMLENFQYNDLPIWRYDYEVRDFYTFYNCIEQSFRPHPETFQTVGSFDAPYIITDDFKMEPTYQDGFFRWPSISFDKSSPWNKFTKVLLSLGIPESEILWVDISEITQVIKLRESLGIRTKIILSLSEQGFYRTKAFYDHIKYSARSSLRNNPSFMDTPDIYQRTNPKDFKWGNKDPIRHYNVFED